MTEWNRCECVYFTSVYCRKMSYTRVRERCVAVYFACCRHCCRCCGSILIYISFIRSILFFRFSLFHRLPLLFRDCALSSTVIRNDVLSHTNIPHIRHRVHHHSTATIKSNTWARPATKIQNKKKLQKEVCVCLIPLRLMSCHIEWMSEKLTELNTQFKFKCVDAKMFCHFRKLFVLETSAEIVRWWTVENANKKHEFSFWIFQLNSIDATLSFLGSVIMKVRRKITRQNFFDWFHFEIGQTKNYFEMAIQVGIKSMTSGSRKCKWRFILSAQEFVNFSPKKSLNSIHPKQCLLVTRTTNHKHCVDGTTTVESVKGASEKSLIFIVFFIGSLVGVVVGRSRANKIRKKENKNVLRLGIKTRNSLWEFHPQCKTTSFLRVSMFQH